MDSKYPSLYLLTEEVMKENRTNPEVVMTEERREEVPPGNRERERFTNPSEGKWTVICSCEM